MPRKKNETHTYKKFEITPPAATFIQADTLTKTETAFVLRSANWPVLLVDATGRIHASSQGARRLFGESIEGNRTFGEAIWSSENEISAEAFLRRFAQGSEKGLELRYREKNGATSSYLTQLCPFPAGGENLFLLQLFTKSGEVEPVVEIQLPSRTTTDIPTAPEPPPLVEHGVAQKQKLDCAMQLIRSVALDFNNALTIILGHASLLLGKTDTIHPFRNSLLEIEKSAQKAGEIAQDLADFSRQDKDPKGRQAGNMNDLVRKTAAFFREAKGAGAEWEFELEPRPYAVHFDEGKLRQAIIKILENAIESLDGPGTIHVKTRNLDVTEETRDGTVRLKPGSYCCVELADTGKGIPSDVLPRVFEPFFTTKKEKGHRGLGLAWVYGVVTNHGGSVAVTSDLNKGTCVRVYLPAQQRVVQDRSSDNGDLTGTQTILLVDDEELLLTMGEMVLSSFGYRVLTANSGIKALEVFKQQPGEIDLVITDMVMPQMSGREVIERLRRLSPDLKVICASGFVRPPAGQEKDNFLQKPFASQDLLRKVKQVLGTAAIST